MATQTGYITSVEGILKIVTIVLGIVTVGCGVTSYNKDLGYEEYFYGAAVACLVASIALYPIFLFAFTVDTNGRLKFIDFIYHIILGIVLIVASSMMLKSAVDNNGTEPDSFIPTPDTKNYDKKVAAGSVGLINGIVYLAASFFVTRRKNDDEVVFSRKYASGS